MTTEESNKLIAEFMGIEPFSKAGQYEAKDIIIQLDMTMNPCIHFNSPLDVIFIDDFKFHSLWDWLMPVVEKIQNTEEVESFNIDASGKVNIKIWPQILGSLYYEYEEFYFIADNKDNFLDVTYLACVKFIKWYNENK